MNKLIQLLFAVEKFCDDENEFHAKRKQNVTLQEIISPPFSPIKNFFTFPQISARCGRSLSFPRRDVN